MAQQSITLANYSDIQQLQSNLATIEATSTASKAYEVGEYLVYGGQLYIVTAAIALSDTLTVGTNIATTTIGDAIGSTDISNIGDGTITGAITASCTIFTDDLASTTGGSGTMTGVYDPQRRTVRLFGWYRNITNVTTSTALFTVPSAYRPSSTQNGAGIIVTTSAMQGYIHDVTSSGGVRQRLSSQTTAGFFYIEYTI